MKLITPDMTTRIRKSRRNKERGGLEYGKDILRKIFGDDFVSDLETLEKKIVEGKEPVIMVDGDLEIPDNLERAAREKNISIAHVHCGAFEVGAGIPFPFPFPPGFLK